MHDVIIETVPLVAILAGILFNRFDLQNLRSEMKSEIGGLRSEFKSELKDLRSEMNTRFDRIDAELRYFHGAIGRLDGRLEAVEKR